MKASPEYELAESLIAHLRTIPELGGSVLEDPWEREDQANAISLAAAASGIALAVMPAWPTVEAEATNAAHTARANLAVAVMATANLPGGDWAANLHAALGRTLAGVMSWQHETSRGIPYAEARIEDIATLDLSEFQVFQNLEGAVIRLSKPVNYHCYYKTEKTTQTQKEQ